MFDVTIVNMSVYSVCIDIVKLGDLLNLRRLNYPSAHGAKFGGVA